jgi:hypothetical protein
MRTGFELFGGQGQRLPETDEGHACAPAIAIERARRHHADHTERYAVETNFAAENVGIAAEALLPRRVADHEHVLRARPIFFLAKGASQHRRDPEHGKVVGGDSPALQPRRFAADLRRRVDINFGRERLKRAQPALHLGEVEGRGRIGPGGRPLPHADNPLGVGEGKRLQQHCVDEAEDRRIGADAECQHGDRDDREERFSP